MQLILLQCVYFKDGVDVNIIIINYQHGQCHIISVYDTAISSSMSLSSSLLYLVCSEHYTKAQGPLSVNIA